MHFPWISMYPGHILESYSGTDLMHKNLLEAAVLRISPSVLFLTF